MLMPFLAMFAELEHQKLIQESLFPHAMKASLADSHKTDLLQTGLGQLSP